MFPPQRLLSLEQRPVPRSPAATLGDLSGLTLGQRPVRHAQRFQGIGLGEGCLLSPKACWEL